MLECPFEVTKELEGWALFWAELELRPGGNKELKELLVATASQVNRELELASLSVHPTVAALRKLFRAAGCDPTRYRPSSEALLRRLLKGQSIPSIHPLVDINNSLSARLAVPCCVMTEGTFQPPLRFRSGRPGESYQSLRGPFNLQAKPLLLDSLGPLDAPITGSERVKITPTTRRAWLVAYLPEGVLAPEKAARTLSQLLKAAPVARMLSTFDC